MSINEGSKTEIKQIPLVIMEERYKMHINKYNKKV